jgi:iron(III) transport system substrate-binding protein
MKSLFLVFLSVLFILSCQKKEENVVIVYTSTDQVFSEPVLKAFEKKTGIKVKMVFDTEETKSTGLLNRLIAEKNNPQCDVFWSNDPLRVEILKQKGILQKYISSNSKKIPSKFKDPDGYWTGFSGRLRIYLVNKNLTKEKLPDSIYSMADPYWKDKFALANPLFGTTSFHIAALFTVWGNEKAKQFLKKITENGLKLAASNGEVAKWVSIGKVTFGFVDTDDAFSMIKEGYPVEIVFPDQKERQIGTLFIPNAVAMIKGAPHPETAKKMIDFLLSPEAEEMLAKEECRQIPLNPDTQRPEDIPDISKIKTIDINYQSVAKKMEEILPFLRQWVSKF